MTAEAPWTLDATEIADRIRRGDISAAEAVEDAIRKVEALEPRIGAIVTSDFERALDKAKAGHLSGPFAGVPFLVKDLDPYKGLPTRNGSRSGLRAPPEEPPAERAGFQGLRVGGKPIGSVVGRKPYSGVADLPMTTKPAASKAST